MITAMPRIAIAGRNFDSMMALFRDSLGLPVIDLSADSVRRLGARLAMCVPPGGSNIELMSPADASAPLAQSLGRFLDRRGEGLFALMLEAPDPNEAADVLAARGLDVLPLMQGAAGRDIHPRSTCGVLIRIYPVDSFVPSHDQSRRAGPGSIGLGGIARVIIAVHDIDRAVQVYGDRLGIETGPAEVTDPHGVVRARCRPPSGGLIELTSLVNAERPYAAAIAAHLAARGEGMFAIVLTTDAPAAAARILQRRGVANRPFVDRADLVELDPRRTFGARVLIEPAGSPER